MARPMRQIKQHKMCTSEATDPCSPTSQAPRSRCGSDTMKLRAATRINTFCGASLFNGCYLIHISSFPPEKFDDVPAGGWILQEASWHQVFRPDPKRVQIARAFGPGYFHTVIRLSALGPEPPSRPKTDPRPGPATAQAEPKPAPSRPKTGPQPGPRTRKNGCRTKVEQRYTQR